MNKQHITWIKLQSRSNPVFNPAALHQAVTKLGKAPCYHVILTMLLP